MRLANARGQPRGIEGAVELDAGEPVGLRLVDQRDRLGLAGRDVGHLRGVGALAVDQRRGVDVRREQRAGGSALAPLERAEIVVARVAHRRHAQRQLLETGVVVADVHVAVPQAGQQGLAAAVDHLRARWHGHRLARADCGDRALVDDDRLVGEEAAWHRRRRAGRP